MNIDSILLPQRLVAIKIFKSRIRHEGEQEADLLERLDSGSAKHSGKKHVVRLLERFHVTGPNGSHLCLVVEALGTSLNVDVPSPHNAWKVARQMVEGISYAHIVGVCHGGMS